MTSPAKRIKLTEPISSKKYDRAQVSFVDEIDRLYSNLNILQEEISFVRQDLFAAQVGSFIRCFDDKEEASPQFQDNLLINKNNVHLYKKLYDYAEKIKQQAQKVQLTIKSGSHSEQELINALVLVNKLTVRNPSLEDANSLEIIANSLSGRRGPMVKKFGTALKVFAGIALTIGLAASITLTAGATVPLIVAGAGVILGLLGIFAQPKGLSKACLNMVSAVKKIDKFRNEADKNNQDSVDLIL